MFAQIAEQSISDKLGMKFGMIDVTQDKELATAQGVDKFPMIK
jgi:hypothetical protein